MAKKPSFQVKPRTDMKTIGVIFVSDDLVEEEIVTRKDYERRQIKRLKVELKDTLDEVDIVKPAKRKKIKVENTETNNAKQLGDELELQLAALENTEVEQVSVYQPTSLFDEKEDVSAGKMFSFEGKKSIAKSPMNKGKSHTNNSTPKIKKLEPIEEEVNNSQGPYNMRTRVFKDLEQIQKILENSDNEKDFSESESEYSKESSSDNENGMTPKKATKGAKSYFEFQGCRAVVSEKTSKTVANTKLTREKIDEIFKELRLIDAHKPQLKDLFRNQVAMFEKWEYLLRHNYNILLYGVGSKKDVVDKFLQRFSNHHPVVKVNGFFPSVTIKEIMEKVCEPLKLDASSADVLDCLKSKLSDYNVEVFIGINNIDGIMLRNKKTQQILSRLAQISQIKLIATIDNINAPLLWDQCLLTDFNWAWFDGTTYLPYTDETIYEGNLLLHPSGQLTLASLRSVFNSLTKNTRAIFLILAKKQSGAEKGFGGVSFQELYHEGRRQLLVSNDAALRLQLKEFIDHAILKQKRSAEGEERFNITLDNSILKQFLEEQEVS